MSLGLQVPVPLLRPEQVVVGQEGGQVAVEVRRRRRLLLGRGAVSAHHLALPF